MNDLVRIWNGTVVQERIGEFSEKTPIKGVVISQTQRPHKVIVRWEGGTLGEWEEDVLHLIVLDESPLVDGTRAYS